MVVCRYFLQGTCRFGNNCNYEHPRNTGYPQSQNQQNRNQQFSNQSHDPNRYKYIASNQSNQSSQSTTVPPTNLFSKLVSSSNSRLDPSQTNPQALVDPENNLSDQEFIDLIVNDFKQYVNSSAWKLSCYSFSKSAPCLPILTDISPEEVRFSVYEAKKFNQYFEEFQRFQLKYGQVIDLLNQIANPNQEMKNYLLKYYHETRVKTTKPTSNVNPFMQIVQNKQQQLIQQQQVHSPPPALMQQAPQMFQIQQNLPVQNFMQSQQTNMIQTSGSFLFTSQNNQNNNQNIPNLFSQLIGSNQPKIMNNTASLDTKTTPINTFVNSNNVSMNLNQTNQNPFNNVTNVSMISSQSAINTGPSYVYSNKNDLTAQDIDEFKSNKFTLSKIPHLPPAEELCFL